MTRDEIKDLIMVILGQADYDLYKSFLPECAEEPEYSAAELERLIDTVEKHLKKLDKKKKVTPKKKAKKKVAKKAVKKTSKKKNSKLVESILQPGYVNSYF